MICYWFLFYELLVWLIERFFFILRRVHPAGFIFTMIGVA